MAATGSEEDRVRLLVISHKPCWSSVASPTGYATDGGFPFQMRALSELFDSTTLVVPCAGPVGRAGEIPLEGHNLSVAPLSTPVGQGLARKVGLCFWFLRNSPIIFRELLRADAVHVPIPGDIGTIGMLLAFGLRKPLFVRHCGNWLQPTTGAEHFWKWFMEKFAGGKQVMLATGGSQDPPSRRNAAIRWIFSTTLSENELQLCQSARELRSPHRAKLIIVCRQEREKGTGVVIQSLPLILDRFPSASLDVVGNGESLVEFQNLAESLGIAERVFFHGNVGHAKVIELLKQADLFCYPTRASEGFPKVVLESLACGLPVIATRVSVLPEIIGSGGGELLDEATPAAVAKSILEILSNDDRYTAMSARAIETARHYSLERWRDTIGDHLRAAWGELTNEKLKLAATSSPDRKHLKVCFVAGTLGRGGAERQLIFMIKALKEAGVDTRVLCLTKGEALEEEIRAMGVTVTWVGASRWRPIRLWRVIQELRRERAHILQSAHFYTNLYVAAAGRLLGIKAIGAIRNDLTSELESHGIMGWGQLHLPGHLITNSELACRRAMHERIKSEHIDIVPNVVEVNGISEQRNGNANGVFRILFVSRLTEQKRPDRFLQALRKILEWRPDLKFRATIIGDGPLRSSLEKLADSLHLRPNYLEFRGELAEVKPAYLNSDLLVLTSDWEGVPNVLLEAMGQSLPVVATKVGGVPELVHHGENGLLVETDEGDSTASSIIALIENSQLRNSMGASGRRVVMEEHSPGRLANRLLTVYQKTLGGLRHPENPEWSSPIFWGQGNQRQSDSRTGSEVEVI
jgi:glycosyltransferase involved in cell wall biosynthesis